MNRRKNQLWRNSLNGNKGKGEWSWLGKKEDEVSRGNQLQMRLMSQNIRGLGGRIKKSATRELVIKEKVDFLCLQEMPWKSVACWEEVPVEFLDCGRVCW